MEEEVRKNSNPVGPTPHHDGCDSAAGRLASGNDRRYVSEGLTLYFLCGLDSQKAKNLARDNRLSLTIDHDTANLMTITGLSMAGYARAVNDAAEAEKVLRMLPLKYPEAPPLPMKMPSPDEVRLFRVTPKVISVLDYTKGFGHADLITCGWRIGNFGINRRCGAVLRRLGE